ncbi:Fic/DOC family protein [Phyllobacterium chamaecytisi]|uniref:Fic/DOC family protein n=1 Tax=Phyllobacterium chamaecytisi TaxID=2876082 RepID=UPI001CCA7EC2|nr:Fic family protein [Phyllobacterium sp. KW56]MBZ9603189.1 Fic family protein [Phyllobacterium sp. KW56]
MVFEGYDAFDDPYSYKGTTTLKNKLGLRDPGLLESFELEMTALRANEPLPEGRFDARHYCRVHHHLFQDIYTWAGKYRTVRTAKGGNLFCFPEHIKSAMDRLFVSLRDSRWLEAEEADVFIESVATFLAELNAIHPFREGNGRSQLAFVDLLGERAQFPFDFSRVERDSFMPAMVASYHGNVKPLIAELTLLLA